MQSLEKARVSLFRRSTVRVRLVVAFCFVAVLLVMLAALLIRTQPAGTAPPVVDLLHSPAVTGTSKYAGSAGQKEA